MTTTGGNSNKSRHESPFNICTASQNLYIDSYFILDNIFYIYNLFVLLLALNETILKLYCIYIYLISDI